MKSLRVPLISLLCGIALSFIQSPYEYWLLIFPCFSTLYFLYTRAENKKQVFIIGFLFSLGYFVTGLNWIGNALLVEGNEFKWVWPLAVIALPTLLSLFTALYLIISFILFKNKNIIGFLGFCAALLISEWVRGHAFTGFPWNLYGYGWIGALEIAQISYWIGPYGLTLLTIFWGSICGFCVTHEKYKIIFAVSLITLISSYFIGQNRLNNNTSFNEDIAVHVVQPNIAQADKWKPEKLAENFEKHVGLSRLENSAAKNIIIWPETALPPSFLSSSAVHQRIKSLLSSNTILLTGVLGSGKKEGIDKTQYYNGLMVWKHDYAPQNVYNKSHLVPFGEYIPFQQYIPIRPVVAFEGFQRGEGATTISLDGFPSFTPKICYEIIFSGQMINTNQSQPDFILTVTNDAWYGDSPGPYQHFTQARFRAIENKMPVIRSANTGISGVIDSYGRIVQSSNLMEERLISSKLPL